MSLPGRLARMTFWLPEGGSPPGYQAQRETTRYFDNLANAAKQWDLIEENQWMNHGGLWLSGRIDWSEITRDQLPERKKNDE